MKKSILLMMLVFSWLICTPLQSIAGVPTHQPKDSTETAKSLQVNALVSRLGELKQIDRSKLVASERRKVRKEAQGIKKELKTLDQGIYLSLGALLLVIILLILLL